MLFYNTYMIFIPNSSIMTLILDILKFLLNKIMTKFEIKVYTEYVGKQFNNLKVIAPIKSSTYKSPKTRLLCLCICGKLTEQDIYDIINGRVRGCGCILQSEEFKNRCKKREEKRHGEYRQFKYMIRQMKKNNKKHNLGETNITKEYLAELWNEQKGICPYTKIKLTLPIHSKEPNPDVSYKMASIDRIDSSKPYIIGNVQFVSRNANYAKNDMSHEDMVKFMDEIKNNLNNEKNKGQQFNVDLHLNGGGEGS